MTDATKKRRRISVRRPDEVAPEPDVVAKAEQPQAPPTSAVDVTHAEEAVDWRDMALRLRADMDNYRRRQQRLAEEQVGVEKKRLLLGFLGVVDNLDRIIRYLDPTNPHQQSIKATYDDMMKLLRLEGVEPIGAVNTPFDPLLHDAVAMIPASDGQKETLLILEEEQKGYRIGDQVLRPARVIVAKR